MKHMKVNARHMMLNDRESSFFAETGNFKRFSECDNLDPEYVSLKGEMIQNGDIDFYKSCCPPKDETPPHFLKG